MIQPLRTVHRRAFVALALVLPSILLIGLGARRPHPGGGAHATDVPDTIEVVRESSHLWQKQAIQTKFYNKRDHPQDIYFALQPAPDLNEPDLLLYWAASAPQGNLLPEDSQLVGAFTPGKAFLLPFNENGAGHLVLFSPAYQTVLDTASLEKLP